MELFKTRSFTWWEIGLIKVCLISFGILLALYFYDLFLGLFMLWWVLFVGIAGYFIYRFMRKDQQQPMF